LFKRPVNAYVELELRLRVSLRARERAHEQEIDDRPCVACFYVGNKVRLHTHENDGGHGLHREHDEHENHEPNETVCVDGGQSDSRY
jgi:hypothetical protein